MRLQSLAILIGMATLIFNLVIGVYFATGIIQTPASNNNIASNSQAMQLMIDPGTQENNGAGDILSNIWNSITGWGYGAIQFLIKIVWLKGNLDMFLPEGPDQYPFNVFIDMFQTLIGTIYGLLIWGLVTNRPTA